MTGAGRVSDYIRSLDSGHGSLCDRIAGEAEKEHVPILKPETAAFLKTMVSIVRPIRILEVGTAVGYSALLMAQTMPADATITTIENYAPRVAKARENFRQAAMEGRITMIEGDAGEVLGQLPGLYDFVFMDAAKGQYLSWLPRILELTKAGSVIFSDNVFQDGDIFESRFAVRRRDRTIHARMREYLYQLKHHPELETSIVPVGDGVALSVRRGEVCHEKH
ncbi:O-methyltransferase [Clostridiaceae bacterium]|nr:O-methyltransferase [Clostridiaceae bacterium]RKI18316.1 O-methyltransferase [bacterium 1XD21-70]